MLSLKTFLVIYFAFNLGRMVRATYWAFTDINYDALKKLKVIPNEYDAGYGNDRVKMNALIFPGTKWCGPGDIAKDYNDLGSEWETDSCCRAHDNCEGYVEGRGTHQTHQLTNDAFHTRLSCECDETFRKCLHAAGTTSAKSIGTIYFNTLGTKCYRKDYPATGCLRQGGPPLRKKCLEYSYDKGAKKTYQWFHVPNYH